MILDEIMQFNPVYIQLHDYPDADAIASGYGLYLFLKEYGHKDVIIFYGGKARISKSNLTHMMSKIGIPITYVRGTDLPPLDTTGNNPILVTVDCQYGARNVTRFSCPEVAIIDHHQMEIADIERSLILPSYNACSTIIWKLITSKNYPVTDEKHLATALYYGIYTDTNQLAELRNPDDRDAVDSLACDRMLVNFLKNSNISLDELEIACEALRHYVFNEEHRYAVVKSDRCDPNVLGLISDFMLQVDSVDVCVVFNEMSDGFKFSVRSCIKEVDASELADFLSEGIGSGGGHRDKAGGYISKDLFEKKGLGITGEVYFSVRLNAYFYSYDLIYADKFNACLSAFGLYVKKSINVGFVKMTDIVPVGTPIICRTLEGDMDLVVQDDLIVMIGVKGEIYPNRVDKFERSHEVVDEKYDYEKFVIDPGYRPTVKNRITGEAYSLVDYAKTCRSTGKVIIYAQKLERAVKIFTSWDKERYMVGKPGDFLAVRSDDLHDVYSIEQHVFDKAYEEVKEK